MSLLRTDIASSLPVFGMAGRVNRALADGSTLVITAPPGAGKSTLLPLTIAYAVEGKVVMLEPRRLAARQVAERMAWLSGEKAGETVGYRVRFENRVSSCTRIEVMTEGILSRMMLEDPTLDGVSVLIFDEYHERNIFSDEALAFAREIRRVLRPDLRIVVMSATIDASSLCDALEAPLLECPGRSFPVELRYGDDGLDARECAANVARAVLRAHRQYEGDILAFLPGESEIRRCCELLQGELGDTRVFPLYGLLPFEEQNRAIAPGAPGERKVVLATSIAETSITIEGVRVVVDSGLCRTQVFNPSTGQSRLETVPVSRDMADQRAGRAGRVAAGVCWRLYSEADYRSMKPFRTPEILDADLVPLALDLAVWGSADASGLSWVTPPPGWKIKAALSVLQALGALDADGVITPLGRRMSAFPCHPRLSRMLIEASSDRSKAGLAADLAAIVGERDPLSSDSDGVDIDLRLDALRRARSSASPGRRLQQILNAAAQYRRLAAKEACSEGGYCSEAAISAKPEFSGRKEHVSSKQASLQQCASLLSVAFPERVGKLMPEGCGRYLLASGDIVSVPASDPISSCDWIVAVGAHIQKGGVGHVFLASAVDPSDLEGLAVCVEKVAWDARSQSLVCAWERRIGALLLDSKPLQGVSLERAVAAVCEAAPRYGLSMFDFSDYAADFQRRVAAVSMWHPELELPDLSTKAVLERASDWLPFHVGRPVNADSLRRIDMVAVLRGLLTFEQQQALDRLAPSHIEVPTGSRIRVEYRQGTDAPVLRVRLQECFGMRESPRVDGGRKPVLMELLSPGFKPVQLTSDLASFWSGTYFEVRKELRRRYPKHSWPDDPLEAQAVRGVRRK